MQKKDAIAAACLRSCQLLDQVGILFPWQSTQDTKRKSKANRGEDDDDDCDMIDETGESELKQAKKQAARQNRAETLDSLNAKWTETCEQLQKLKSKLVRISMHDPGRPETMPSSGAELDALESYMSSIQNQDGNTSRMANKIEKSKLKMQISQLTKEQARLERLIKIAKPSFKLPDMPKMMISSKAKDLLAKAQQKLQKHASAIADVVGTSNQSTADLSSPLHSSLEPKSQSTINAESDVCKSSQVSDDKNLHEIDLSATSKTEQKRSNKSHSQSASTSAFSNVSTSAISTLTTTVSSSSSFSNINLKLGSIHTVEKPAEFANATQTVGETRSQRKGGLNLCSSADNPNKKIKPIPASKRTATSATYLDDSAYVEWTPPTDQSGDGKTSLNKKFGYWLAKF